MFLQVDDLRFINEGDIAEISVVKCFSSYKIDLDKIQKRFDYLIKFCEDSYKETLDLENKVKVDNFSLQEKPELKKAFKKLSIPYQKNVSNDVKIEIMNILDDSPSHSDSFKRGAEYFKEKKEYWSKKKETQEGSPNSAGFLYSHSSAGSEYLDSYVVPNSIVFIYQVKILACYGQIFLKKEFKTEHDAIDFIKENFDIKLLK